MKRTSQREREAQQVIDAYWDNYIKGDVEAMIPLLDDAYIQVGSAESEVFFNKKDAVRFLYDTIDEVAGKVEMRNRSTKVESLEGFFLVSDLCDLYVFDANEWIFYAKFRASSLLQKKKGTWKLVHQHSSVADARTEAGGNLAIEDLAAENVQLREAVRRRTVALEHKNRALEIEAALERVRAKTMAMHNSDELRSVIAVVFEQLKGLGFDAPACGLIIFDEHTGDAVNWLSGFGKEIFPVGYHIPHVDHPYYQAWLHAWKSGKPYENFIVEGDQKKSFDDYLFEHSDFKNVPLEVQHAFRKVERAVSSNAFMKHGMLGVLGAEEAIGEAEKDIIQRFAKVFDQTYTRFLDLQTAEAQAREAQIEAALERVRSRAMAMRSSDELAEFSYELVKEVQALGVATWHCAFNIYDEDQESSTEWGANADGFYPIYKTPRVGIFRRYYEIGQTGETLHIEEIGEDECADHYDYLCTLPGVGEVLCRLRDSGVSFPTSQIDHVAYFKYGYLIFITYEPVPDAHDIFKRFAKVFEQSYTRFLDLKKSEEQAREAQIEAALERVRSRTMAMQHSDELAEVSRLLNREVIGLGTKTWGCAFNIYGEDESTEWFGTEVGPMPTYPTPREEFFLRFYEKGQEGETLYVEAFEGDACKAHYDYMCTLPVLGDMLAGIKAAGHAFPSSQIDHVAYFKYGYLLFITLEPAPEAHDVFRRFANVFEQTYTRFLDLEQAEARTRETQIEAAMERVRSRALAMTSSEELLDVIFKIHREFIGLGLPCELFWQTRYTPACYQKALTGIGGKKISAIMELPRDFSSVPELAAWERGDEKIGVFKFDADAACSYLHHMITKGHFLEVDPEGITEDMVREHDGFTFVQARTSHGEIGYSLWGETEPSEEAKDVLIRFTSAFDLAYRRFEDLQQAEADHQALLEEKALTEQTLEELRATQAQLIQSEKMASLGQLTAGIAHEIKNPLNFVNNFAEINEELIDELGEFLEEGVDAAVRELLADLKQNASVIAQHGKRADAIVHAMMQHASGGRGQREPTDINQLISEHIDLAYHGKRAQVPDLTVEIKRDLGEDVGAVKIVPQELGRVLLNLLGNAFDAVREHTVTAAGGYTPTVTVSARQVDSQVEIRVSDNGPGIPPGIREKIFEPFFTTKPTGSGTGLGLSLSYDIITQGHGGTLAVESEEGQGATFIVTLPVSKTEPASRA